jgi:hypothetical protein
MQHLRNWREASRQNREQVLAQRQESVAQNDGHEIVGSQETKP